MNDTTSLGCRAIHLEGGNFFHDVRLDVSASIAAQRAWRENLEKRSVARSAVASRLALKRYDLTARLGLREAIVNNGRGGPWFKEFCDWWGNAVQGRPLTLVDFLGLRFLYRTRAQHTSVFDWSSADQHLANWQAPENIAAVFDFVYRDALWPMRPPPVLDSLGENYRVLEYGCSIAPMYRTWRRFLSHRRASWILADIPNFPFHYAGHVYARDAEATFAYIEDLGDPLRDVDGTFDLIVVKDVFEHLDEPLQIAELLVSRLAPGGFLLFNYIAKDEQTVVGHDTPAGAEQRMETLRYLSTALDGQIPVTKATVPLGLARRRTQA